MRLACMIIDFCEVISYCIFPHSFNSSFNLGLVPDSLKIAKITPIFKSGPKNLISNYRHISVLPYFSKILDKLMATRLSTNLDNFALLSPAQFGFQRGKSTYMTLLEMQTCISEAMNFNKYSLGVFFDISKAFDTVNHTLLINKLEHYEVLQNNGLSTI